MFQNSTNKQKCHFSHLTFHFYDLWQKWLKKVTNSETEIRRKTDITKMAKKKQEMKTNNGRQNTTEKTKDWAT
jgi:hypothetical protein